MLLVLFRYKPVQTWAAQQAAGYLSNQLQTEIGIESLYIKPFSSVVLEGLYVLDKQKDTLLSAPKLTVDLNSFSLFSSVEKRVIDFKHIELDNGSVFLKKQKDSTSNVRFIINYFSSGGASKSSGRPWKIIFETIDIDNLHFRYKNQLVDTVIKEVNFDDIDVKNFSATIKNMDLQNHLFKADVSNLTLREKSGFYLKKFDALATVDSNQIVAKNLFILTNHSSLKNYFRMKFKSFDDIGDHINDKVYLDGDFHFSRISSADISYFTDGLSHVRFDLGLDGRIKGYVNNLKAKKMLITGGKATYIRGDFNLTGLPDWNKTFLDLKFDEIATNKADIDFLYSQFTATPNRHVPDIISKFGNVNFTGQFKGFQHDFTVSGTFKTKLGRFDPDVTLKISKGVPAYHGKIDTYAFDLGSLLDEETLGRVTLSANVDGSGDDLANLSGKINSNIAEIDFKGYNYKNLTLDGSFDKKVANADITIDDENVKLKLNGNVDFNPVSPFYNIKADIRKARLHALNLLADTITITSQVTAGFSGNSLNSLNGNASFVNSRIVGPRNDYSLGSLVINSVGTGKKREIDLKSDFADGYIKGSYDLETLPSYFKTIIKKYMPSLNTAIVTPKPQEFNFKIDLKNPDPLIAFFKPNISIPDQGTIVGKFNSENKTETVDAYIKTIKAGKTVFHDFILDETTYNDYLGMNVSLNKVDLTDSLFIKNITINNSLKNDSLSFNVKLSDQNAINSLDLYGMANFGKDTTVTVQLLPSDVILEHQDWKIADKVRIKLLSGKTQVSDFELSNGAQKVKIDGTISADPVDQLKLSFEKFSMATFNQLTRKQEGVQLKGMLNGDVKFSSLLKSPGVDAGLGIDSLMLNKTLVGDVKIESDLARESEKANVKVSVRNHGVETLDVAGAYQIGHGKDDSLNFAVKMNQTDGVVFEPFINDLVSKVRGKVSTNLMLTGTPSKPRLNGDIILSNAGVTVNYLKTAYWINDTLHVTNSIINVDNLQIRDVKGGVGRVMGKVDLNNASNPDIELVLTAKNLMALNTTFKDNHLYYGTAFANGRFSFSGPANNMKIDIIASTGAGTIFNIPLNTSTTVSDNDFIRFVDHHDTIKVRQKTNQFNGVTLNFDLSVDENSTVRITTDYGVLEGKGHADDLKLNINSLGDFEMFGDFSITSGKFDFVAKNFFSKNFLVNQGGIIRWTGNPANATIDLSAVYEVRTNIAPLYLAAGSKSPKGDSFELVDAELILTKSLLQPDINFNFNFPLDPSIKDDLSNYLSDVNNRNQQALSIIVRRQFFSSNASGTLSNQVTSTAGEVLSETVFNKVNSFFSQSNLKGLNVNIRGIGDVSLNYHITNRLIFTGSLFNTATSTTSGNSNSDLFQTNASIFNSNFNTLTKDIDVQYLIRQDGSLRANYAYRVLNSTTLSSLYEQLNEDYVNALGLIYQKDFDTFGEFIRLLFKKQPTPKEPPKNAPAINTPVLTEKPKEQDDQ